ncbi:MAG TPA: AAA family ATPase [Stellaceae bacterium]|nr:AAA family ATPase [Stellaceae bacterium]
MEAIEQAEVIDFLSRPETFGGREPVETIETHASLVFLAGDRAYKLKKAVRYSYLDYSTPERRHAACAAEYRINRAVSPALYLGVEPIARRPDGTLALGGAGQPLDWVVVMRRFASEAQLDRVADRGALDVPLALALADRIVAFHEAAAIRCDRGGADGIRLALDLTAENLRLAADTVFDVPSIERWIERAAAAFVATRALLDRRRHAGKVRACHGDLHLQNICLVDDQPALFDAIEFDEAISCIDVLYDLAFLLMDLERRSLRRTGNLIFNRYLDRRPEADGIGALPLFLALRAAIRAQVRATAARQQAGDPDIVSEARTYLDLAERLLDPVAPRLIAVGGPSGSGKSTVARELAPPLGRAPGARVIRSDMIRKRLAGVAPETPLPPAAYTEATHAETYAAVIEEALLCLRAGQSVVVDAVHGQAQERSRVATAASSVRVPFFGLWLDAPPSILRDRLARRRNDASDATAEVLENQLRSITPPSDWLRLDADCNAAEIARNALARLG